ncbi:protocatechuate 3,4-dioxygenase beta subunit [Actinokineospora baliensis]|uniref:dioxygenase family protein n=1 Tax=Actinokineospora baliensis TaxID=547056 RepID=UPI001956A32D|nr:twin-arginine translocation pathway signal protein [Actinokineospora baliensis]MBM7773770.1 protocatechuate 3,4-dioxygenase beta subunit [Actinokineospora baliensis]
MSHDDDEPVGRVLGRRQALVLLGVGALALAGCSTEAPVDCVVRPEQMEGPYFVDENLDRSDIRSDPATGVRVAGTPLALTLTVLRADGGGCQPLPGAVVDIWHCDAAGDYSDIASEGTTGTKHLRGLQVSGTSGRTAFTTVLPGWYEGRTVHIHVKIRTTGADGKAYEFTSQLYFPDELTARYLATAPYQAHGPADTTNKTDQLYQQGGDQLLLTPTEADVDGTRGYRAAFTLALDLTNTKVGTDDAMGPMPMPTR